MYLGINCVAYANLRILCTSSLCSGHRKGDLACANKYSTVPKGARIVQYHTVAPNDSHSLGGAPHSPSDPRPTLLHALCVVADVPETRPVREQQCNQIQLSPLCRVSSRLPSKDQESLCEREVRQRQRWEMLLQQRVATFVHGDPCEVEMYPSLFDPELKRMRRGSSS